jgi:hypothetical protein
MLTSLIVPDTCQMLWWFVSIYGHPWEAMLSSIVAGQRVYVQVIASNAFTSKCWFDTSIAHPKTVVSTQSFDTGSMACPSSCPSWHQPDQNVPLTWSPTGPMVGRRPGGFTRGLRAAEWGTQ